jgi:hypothetical protein
MRGPGIRGLTFHARREVVIVDEEAKRRSMEQVRAHLWPGPTANYWRPSRGSSTHGPRTRV